MKIPFYLFIVFLFTFLGCQNGSGELDKKVISLDKTRVLDQAKTYMDAPIKTITAAQSERSTGGLHDFYSEGDYWWPDTANPEGPYIRKDGMTNPDNFTAHRIFMRELSLIVPALVSAYLITDEEKYAERAIDHLNAWFADEETRMNPHMLYSQAIYGRTTGRGIGIIDAIHLVEVVKAAIILDEKNRLKDDELEEIKEWFHDFNTWITTHPYGLDEKTNGNNHSTCWAMQVAMYARFTENDSLLDECERFYKNTLLPEQMAVNGSFPKELSRTKPYGYSLFNLDAMYTLVHILANHNPEIWNYAYNDSLHIKKAVDFMYPYIKNKDSWPYPPDVMYFDDWPMRHPALLYAYMVYGDEKYFELWKQLNPDSDKNEIIRNYFIRQPVLWVSE